MAAAGCAPTPLTSQSPTTPPAYTVPDVAPAAPSVSIRYDAEVASPFEAAEQAYRVAQATSRQVVVKLDDPAALEPAVSAGWLRVVKVLPTMDAAVAEVITGDTSEAIAALQALPGVRHAERDGLAVVGGGAYAVAQWSGDRRSPGLGMRRPVAPMLPAQPVQPAPAAAPASTLGNSPNDPRFSSQWAFGPIAAVSAWGAVALATASNAQPVVIAILDTGIDQNHEDIDPDHRTDDRRGKLLRDINFTDSSTVDDRYGHGTHVAGVAAAATNNRVGIAGVYPDAQLMNVKVISDSGVGYDSAIASGIRWAADNGADILNMSFGQNPDATLIREAIAYAQGKGVLMVAAAGNEGTSTRRYPAAYPQVIGVAATTQPAIGRSERLAEFSSYGASWVDVAAPGEAIFSTLPNHANTVGTKHYGSMNGTSMATPMVAAQAAMLWRSSGGEPAKVRARIEATSDTTVTGSGVSWSRGRINCYRSVTEP
jgi:thermitase